MKAPFVRTPLRDASIPVAQAIPDGVIDDPSQPTPSFLPSMAELMSRAAELAPRYRTAAPFPHLAVDGIIDIPGLREVAAELPSRKDPGWTAWETQTEWKYVCDRPELFGPAARRLAREMNATEFVRFLERLTGINGLIPDPHLRAAGYFDVPVGGFLRPHIDFTTNDELGLVRRLNALVYLNEGWSPEWGGELELWRTLTDGPEVSIVPEMGRLAIFNTPNAPHGHPNHVNTPDGRTRLCFSTYYYTSPSALDSPTDRSGIRWGEKTLGHRSQRAVELLAPPIVTRQLKKLRQTQRRRKAVDDSSVG